jgi:hypothetical protein
LNNGTHTSSTEKPLKTEETSTVSAPEPMPVEKSKQISADAPPLNEEAVKVGNAEEADISTNSALNDSVMAVYGGKDETFMENSTLEQSVDMTADQTNDSVTNNLTSNSSNPNIKVEKDDIKDTSSTPQNMEASSVDDEKASLTANQENAPAQDGTTSTEQTKEVATHIVEDSVADVDADAAPSKVEEKDEAKMETAVEGEAVQETPSKDETSEDKTDRGGKRQRDR